MSVSVDVSLSEGLMGTFRMGTYCNLRVSRGFKMLTTYAVRGLFSIKMQLCMVDFMIGSAVAADLD